MSAADELEKLSRLLNSGVITDDEFAAQKNVLLSGSAHTDHVIVSKKKISTYRKIRGVYLLALAAINLTFFNNNSGMIALAFVFGALGLYLLIKDNI